MDEKELDQLASIFKEIIRHEAAKNKNGNVEGYEIELHMKPPNADKRILDISVFPGGRKGDSKTPTLEVSEDFFAS